MPTYDYKCDACGHAFEKFQSIKADPLKVCPNCGQETVRRLIGMGAGLIFKGSGFYITDYREKGYADQAKADSGTPKTEAKGDGSKSEKPVSTEPSKSTGDSGSSTPSPTPSPTPTPSATPAAKSES